MKDALFWPGAGGGGGSVGAVKKSTIVVTYPVGADCFVSNGTKAYRALDKSGTAAFIVEPGTWNVSATLGSDYASENKTVEAGGWAEVELTYSLVLFNGEDNTEVTGGWTATGNNVSAANVTIGAGLLTFTNKSNGQNLNGMWYCGPVNKINVTDYSTYKVIVESMTASGYIGLGPAQTYTGITGTNSVAKLAVDAVGTYELDVSKLSGEYFLGFGSYRNTQENHTWTFSLFELKP